LISKIGVQSSTAVVPKRLNRDSFAEINLVVPFFLLFLEGETKMLDITKISSIITHLKTNSSYYKESSNEIIIFCPYCDDSTRPKANHGHLYISKSMPVFNCFRCSSSGNLIRLLIDIGFDDEDILKYLSNFIRYKTIKDYYKVKKQTTKLKQIQDNVIRKNIEFENRFKNEFFKYKQYLYSRLGVVDYSKFLISPTFYNNKISCLFTNSINEDVTLRLVEEKQFHINSESSGKYFFQENNFEKYKQIVLAEGAFDIIPLYLYNLEFRDSYFIALNGKKYNSTIEELIIRDFLIRPIIINLIFDSEVTNYNTYLYRARLLSKQYNTNILIKGWKPIILKDTGDFPVVAEINERSLLRDQSIKTK
jgi:hypothetical protein